MMFRWNDENAVEAWWDNRMLFRYVYRPEMPAADSPRPYFHPLCTLNGTVVTDYAPDDHRWHVGLSLALPWVSGSSFWGGPTYVHGQGYVQLPIHGRVEHIAWQQTENHLRENLRWIGVDGNAQLSEQRTIRAEINAPDRWLLHLDSDLQNVAEHPLEFVSPAGFGRAGAGYGGMFWRGSALMCAGQIHTAAADGEAAVQGTRSSWLEYRSRAGEAALRFSAAADSADYPPRWFVRAEEYPGVCYALAFDQRYTLAEGQAVSLRYTIEIVG